MAVMYDPHKIYCPYDPHIMLTVGPPLEPKKRFVVARNRGEKALEFPWIVRLDGSALQGLLVKGVTMSGHIFARSRTPSEEISGYGLDVYVADRIEADGFARPLRLSRDGHKLVDELGRTVPEGTAIYADAEGFLTR